MVQFEIIRSKRKTMRLSVQRDGRVVVYAPQFVSDREAENFVARHIRWIESRQSERKKISLADGERLEVCGKLYTVQTGARAKIEQDTLFLPQQEREGALIALLKRLTRERMEKLLRLYSERMGCQYSCLRVCSARGRWGSCSGKKTISFTFRTAFLPDELAEYLAVHELSHTKEMNHGKRFWALVGSVFPDYLARRKALKGYLWAMNIL